jgi:hypothetical protein
MARKASLDSLPAEILNHVAGELCVHCRWGLTDTLVSDDSAIHRLCTEEGDKPEIYHNLEQKFTSPADDPGNDEEILTCIAALASLARTCTALRYTANSYLYHWPQPQRGQVTSLVRTLFERPDLGECVQDLHMKHRFWMPKYNTELEQISDENLTFFKNLVKTRMPPTGDSRAPPVPFEPWHMWPCGTGEGHLYEADIVLVALTVSQTPNLITLEIESNALQLLPCCYQTNISLRRSLRVAPVRLSKGGRCCFWRRPTGRHLEATEDRLPDAEFVLRLLRVKPSLQNLITATS